MAKNGRFLLLLGKLSRQRQKRAFRKPKLDGLVNVHDTEMLSPPRMKIGTLCQAKGAAVMRSNFL